MNKTHANKYNFKVIILSIIFFKNPLKFLNGLHFLNLKFCVSIFEVFSFLNRVSI